MPHRIKIEDADVRAIERALGDVDFGDEYRMAALRCSESCDIQACPGSGKTTLLVAKLAILASRWRWNDRGILVLSHTNVARQEIQERLAKIGGHKLLEFPHFVGTIQRFTNYFLALPHLRNSELPSYLIDDKRFGDRAEYLLNNSPAYKGLCYFLSNRRFSGSRIVRGLRYEDAELTIGSSFGSLPCGLETPSGKALQKLKNRVSSTEGIFRYDDMFAIAERYLRRHRWIVPALQYRFPWVFIDEMQDTDELQDRLLQAVFGEASLVQRIGDTNQAIFGSTYAKESSSTSFPSSDALELPESRRYCHQIARLAKPLTRAVDPQDMTGNSQIVSRQHTIFTFERDTIGNVLPAFGRLLEQEFRGGLPDKFCAKALGARKSGSPGKKDNSPFLISDYFRDFSSVAASTGSSFSSLFEAVLNARSRFQKSRDFNESWGIIVSGLLDLLRIQGVVDPIATEARERPRHYSRTSLMEQLSKSGYERVVRLEAFDLLAEGTDMKDRAKWEAATNRLTDVLENGIGVEEWRADARVFCQFVEVDSAVQGSARGKANVYLHKVIGTGPNIEIGLSTIHAAKGETHTATLVLDTYFDRAHDLKMVLPFLLGKSPKITPALRRRMKRTFVAMTRPRELLCLAMRRDHVEKHRNKLAKDWNLIDL